MKQQRPESADTGKANGEAAGTAPGAFGILYDIVARLRGPDGCPWDREQTPSSLRACLIEETYECVEAIDDRNAAGIREELGDVFLVATMLAYMHEESGAFSVADVLAEIREKLIRRHPHVFGEKAVRDSAEVLKNWEAIKTGEEGRRPKDSVLDGVRPGLPPLDRALKLQKKAAKAGFDWSDPADVIKKVNEELAEVTEAAAAVPEAGTGSGAAAAREKLEGELGDLLFTVVNLCRFFAVDPSVALHRTNVKVTRRFRHVEKRMKESGREMRRENLPAMDAFWEEAKKTETPAQTGADPDGTGHR